MAKLVIEAEIDSKGAVTGLKAIQNQVTKTSAAMESGTKSTKGLTSAFGGGFKSMLKFSAGMAGITSAAALVASAITNNIKTAREFEKSMSNLRALTGLAGKDLEYLGNAAKRMGASTTQSATQVVEAMKLIGSQKPELLKNKEGLAEVTAQAITLAEAAGMEVPEAATALTSALNQMGAGAGSASEYINILAAASQQGAADINYVNQAIVKAGATANMAKIPFNELTAAIEAVATGGYDASSAGTALRNIFLRLEKQANNNLKPSVVGLSAALDNLAKSGMTTTQQMDLFGTESIAVANTLVKERAQFDALKEGITGTNTAYDQAAINTNNFDGSMTKLSSAWEGLNLQLNSSNGILKSFIDWCTQGVEAATELFKTTKQQSDNRVETKTAEKRDTAAWDKYIEDQRAKGMTDAEIIAAAQSTLPEDTKQLADYEEMRKAVAESSDRAKGNNVFKRWFFEKTHPGGNITLDGLEGMVSHLQSNIDRSNYIVNALTAKAPDKTDTTDTTTETTEEEAKRAQELADFRDAQARKEQRAERDRVYAAAQAKIDALKDGSEKTKRQIELNYITEVDDIMRGEEDEYAAREAAARREWELNNQDKTKTWTNSGAQKAWRAQNTIMPNEELRAAADDKYKNNLDAFYADAIKGHEDYYAKRLEIERKYAEQRANLTYVRDQANASGRTGDAAAADRALQQTNVDEAKERLTLAMEELKADPAFVQAFEDLDTVSVTTLDNLYARLEQLRPALSDLPAQDLKTITDLMAKISSAKIARSAKPVRQLTEALKELRTAQENGKEDDIVKAQAKVTKAYNRVIEDAQELTEAIRGVGNAIGGEAAEIIGLIADISDFVTNTMSSMQRISSATAQAISTAEKASVILAIVQAAIQVFQKLNQVLNKFSASAKQDELVAKQKAINKLTDAVNEYTYAVQKANQEEESWFGEDELRSLQHACELSATAYENYFSKLYETQVEYRNKSKNDNNWTNIAGILMPGSGLYGSSVAGFVDGMTGGVGGYTTALENLRIETRSRKKSVFGIGGHNQETEDLRDWARENFDGAELFDADNFINVELAQTIIDSYGDKLQGETQDTLEALIELKEQYDEYMESLQDYVSSLYGGIADNMVDALWDWLDTGKDALDAFKDYASDTFKSIVSDLMKQIVLKDIVGTFSDDITDIYDDYFQGQITAAEMMQRVTNETGALMDRYETGMPGLKALLEGINGMLDEIGAGSIGSGEASATINAVQSVSEDTANELVGRMTAIQLSTESEKATYQAVAENIYAGLAYMTGISTAATQGAETLEDMRSLMVAGNEYLADIAKYCKVSADLLTDDLDRITNNTNKL